MEDYIKMDYALKTIEERKERVELILANTPPEKLKPSYLEKLADYLIDVTLTKEEKQKKKIITENRLITLNKREMSFEGLATKLENGEDGIYNMIANDKNIIFQPKAPITEEDIAEIPFLAELRSEIVKLEERCKTARGKDAFILRKQLIALRQDQYAIKAAYRKPIHCINLIKSFHMLDLNENIIINDDGHVESDGIINFYNPTHISAVLCNYSKLKEGTWDRLHEDAKWMLFDLENLVDLALKERHPLYYDLLIYKIDGKENLEIQSLLYNKYNIKHSLEYLSSLWRNKIPKLIAEEAENQYLIWHYKNVDKKHKWKTCNRCGKEKPAHPNFFNKNKTSRDGFYSICKCCRNKADKSITSSLVNRKESK